MLLKDLGIDIRVEDIKNFGFIGDNGFVETNSVRVSSNELAAAVRGSDRALVLLMNNPHTPNRIVAILREDEAGLFCAWPLSFGTNS